VAPIGQDLILVCQLGVLSVLNVCGLMVLMFSEECIWERNVDGLKKLCRAGCGENEIEPSCPQEGLYSMGLVVMHCNDLTFLILRMYK
jgi:hypothetical protein